MKKLIILTIALGLALNTNAQQATTYAEKLGWPKGARVIILHVDDAGMSHDIVKVLIKASQIISRYLDPMGNIFLGIGIGILSFNSAIVEMCNGNRIGFRMIKYP